MNSVLQSENNPHRWRVKFCGQIDDVEQAVEALTEVFEEAWIGFMQSGDDDEVTVTITLKWLDIGMTRMLGNILDSDHPDVKLIYNGGVDINGNGMST